MKKLLKKKCFITQNILSKLKLDIHFNILQTFNYKTNDLLFFSFKNRFIQFHVKNNYLPFKFTIKRKKIIIYIIYIKKQFLVSMKILCYVKLLFLDCAFLITFLKHLNSNTVDFILLCKNKIKTI